MECYIDYLDCKNNFRETTKDFETYEEAVKWARENFDKYDPDYINFY